MSDAQTAPLDKDPSSRRSRRRRSPKGMARDDASNGARPGKAKGDATRAKGNSARRAGGRHAGPVYAAVDLGTNNCRLLIARPNAKDRQQSFTVVDAFSRIVRLGEGLGHHGTLSEKAMERTVAALNICAGKIRRQGATRVDAVATEACRQASNYPDFVSRVEKETGLKLRLISGQEEAAIAP